MSESRDEMIAALRSIVLPAMRDRGFKGSMPHFRRPGETRIDLITFQFDRNGGGFVLEISQCGPTGFTTYWGKQIEPSKVTAWDLSPKIRIRLHPYAGSGTDSWFRYDGGKSCSEVAMAVLPYLASAESLFKDFDAAITAKRIRDEIA